MLYYTRCVNILLFLCLLYYCMVSICDGVKGTLTFMHRHTRCTSSQGPLGLGYGPPKAIVWLLQAGKAIAGGLPPTAVAQDVMSYRISSRWRTQRYVTVYVIYRQYKSGCNPILGSPMRNPEPSLESQALQ